MPVRFNSDGSISVGILPEFTPRDVKPEAETPKEITSPDVKPAKKPAKRTVKK